MSSSRPDRELATIRAVVTEADADQPLTAREILALLEERGMDFESAHQVATVLGRGARTGDVEVIESSPYRYRLGHSEN